MNLLSNVLQKRVVSKCDCRVVGTVKNVYFSRDFKKIAYFILENHTQDVYGALLALPFDDVKSVGDVIVIVDCVPLLSIVDLHKDELAPDLLKKEVFLQNGTSKGKLLDVEFSKAGKVANFVCAKDSVSPSMIWQAGDVILLKGEQAKQSKRKLPRPQIEQSVTLLEEAPLKTASVKTTVQPEQATPARTMETSIVSTMPKPVVAFCAEQKEPVLSQGALIQLAGNDVSLLEDEHTPTRIICEYGFLLGRTLTNDVTSYLGEHIASKGEVVDDALVEKCRRQGKLVELTLNSQHHKG